MLRNFFTVDQTQMFKRMQSVSSANFSTNAKHEHLPVTISMSHIIEFGLVQEARLISKRINPVKKVPAKVPAQTVLNGLKPIEKDMAGYGLTINATRL